MLTCGIIGFGGLGKHHFGDLCKMTEKVKIAALCDVDEEQFSKKTDTNLGNDRTSVDLSRYHLFSDYHKMLADLPLDFVVVALPTFLHAEVSVAAMEAGCHVFCEKPMALSNGESRRMLETSRKTGKLLMIGHNLRFWPDFRKLKELIDSGEYGAVVRADFSRLSATPKWGWQKWFMDESKSGGSALDLHIHDVDAINWMFGPPQYVLSSATHFVTRFDSISTSYFYPDGKIVTAVSDWGMAEKFPFRMCFIVRFEKAVAEMDPDGFRIITDDLIIKPQLPEPNSYYDEMLDFVQCIEQGKPISINPPEYSMTSLKIALAEKESALKGAAVVL
ncbi:MAG: Gfo/Idh/MocA family oxidoreductase [Treponema sp.]|nr:Gfo/Idh/MocA family oxidoreductase [Treponema sp.]